MHRQLLPKLALCVGALLSAVGCEPETFTPIKGLTVVAVEVDPPTANPGEIVSLDLTYVDPTTFSRNGAASDAGAEGSATAPIQVAWFGGCHNPPRESATGCLPLLGEVAAAGIDLLQGGDPDAVDPDLASQIGFGTHFELQIPEGSVADRQRRPDLIPFGLSYAFFAVCRGELTLLPEARERLPVSCIDSDGQEVDEHGFTIGFTTIHVFDEIESEAPKVLGVSLAGEEVASASCSEQTDCASLGTQLQYACVERNCIPALPACGGDCEPLSLAPIVDRSASELDPATARIGDEPKHEMVWVKYYAPGGLDRLEALVIDREGKMRSGFPAKWTPPPGADRVVPLFTVVQDSRGGTTPARIDVLLTD